MNKAEKVIQTLSLTFALTLTIAACEGNKNQNQAVTLYPNCVNCGELVNGQEFFRADMQDYSGSIRMSLGFAGNTVFNSYSHYYLSPIITYAGPVAAQGTLLVNGVSGATYWNCALPQGQYSVTTIQAGNWIRSILGGVRMQATGPANVVLTIQKAQVSAKQYNQMGQLWTEVPQIGRLFGDVVVESVNGYSCNQKVLMN